MAGQTIKLTKRCSSVSLAGQPQYQRPATKPLTRQASTASLLGQKSLLRKFSKPLIDKDEKCEGVTLNSINETQATTQLDGLIELKDSNKKIKRTKKAKLSFRDVVEMSMGELKPLYNSRQNLDAEQFKSLVIQKVQEVMEAVNVDGECKISINNVLTMLRALDVDTAHDSILDLLRRSIVENSSHINLQELDETVMKWLEMRSNSDIDACVISAFKFIDQDEDGYITTSDLKQLMVNLGQEVNDHVINDMMRSVIPEQDVGISLREFSQFLLGKDITTRRCKFASLIKNVQNQQTKSQKVLDSDQTPQSEQDDSAFIDAASSKSVQVKDGGSLIVARSETSAKRRNFFGGNFIDHKDTTLEGMFDSLSTKLIDASSVDSQGDGGTELQLQEIANTKSHDSEAECLHTEADIDSRDVCGFRDRETKESDYSVKSESNDVMSSGDDSSDDEPLITPHVFVKITKWKHSASKEVAKNLGTLSNNVQERIVKHSYRDENHGSTVTSQSLSDDFDRLDISSRPGDQRRAGLDKNCGVDDDVGESCEGENYLPAEEEMANSDEGGDVASSEDDIVLDAIIDANKLNHDRNSDIEFQGVEDDGIDLVPDLSSYSVNKPDYIQQWLAFPSDSSPRAAQIKFDHTLAVAAKQDAPFLASLSSQKLDLSLTKSNFTELHKRTTPLCSDYSSDFGNLLYDTKLSGKGKNEFEVSLSFRSEEINAEDHESSRLYSTDVSEPQSSPNSMITEHQSKRTSLCRNCLSATSVRTCISPPNKIPLSCKTIEVQELEINSPVTANQFSNRQKFGSLPKDVTKFLVLRKASSPGDFKFTPNDKRACQSQTSSSLKSFKRHPSSCRSLVKSHLNFPVQKNQSYSRNLTCYLKVHPDSVSKKVDQQKKFAACLADERIQSLQWLIQTIGGRDLRHSKISTKNSLTKQSQVSFKNETAWKNSNCAQNDRLVLDSLRIDTSKNNASFLFTNSPFINQSFTTNAEINRTRRPVNTTSISRQLLHSGMTYKMNAGGITKSGSALKWGEETSGTSGARDHHFQFSLDDKAYNTFRNSSHKSHSDVGTVGHFGDGKSAKSVQKPPSSAWSDSACLRKSRAASLQLPNVLQQRKYSPESS